MDAEVPCVVSKRRTEFILVNVSCLQRYLNFSPKRLCSNSAAPAFLVPLLELGGRGGWWFLCQDAARIPFAGIESNGVMTKEIQDLVKNIYIRQ